MDQYAIGLGVKNSALIFFETTRRTGRTTRMVDNLKTGDRVIFASSQEAHRVKKICWKKGIEIKTRVIDPREHDSWHIEQLLRNGRYVLDHSWVEMYYINAIDKAQRDIDSLQSETSHPCCHNNKLHE